jgi:hypothetical protein
VGTFGVHLFLEMQDTLDEKPSKPFEEVQKEVRVWKKRTAYSESSDGDYMADYQPLKGGVDLVNLDLELAV